MIKLILLYIHIKSREGKLFHTKMLFIPGLILSALFLLMDGA